MKIRNYTQKIRLITIKLFIINLAVTKIYGLL